MLLSFFAWSDVQNNDLQVYGLVTVASIPQTGSEHIPLPKQARNKSIHYHPANAINTKSDSYIAFIQQNLTL